MSKIFFKASIVVWLNLPLSFYDNIPIILKKAPNTYIIIPIALDTQEIREF